MTLACTPACPLDQFGAQVAVGDVNGDGYADVAVSSLQSGGTNDEVGAVYVFQSAGVGGIPSALYSAAQTTLTGAQPIPNDGSQAGFGVSLAMGDFNGDGYADIAVGAPTAASTNPTYWDYETGAVYLFDSAGNAGVASASYASATVTYQGILYSQFCCGGDQFGHALGVGDINADGYADLVVTSSRAFLTYVFESQNAPVSGGGPAAAQTVLKGTGSFGATVAMADPNGDGFTDFIVGDSYDGVAYVFESSGLPAIANGDVGLGNTVLQGTPFDFGTVVAP